MFRPQTMSRVELAVPERDVVAVTEVLAASGVFQLARTSHLGSDLTPHYTEGWYERAPAFAGLEQRILSIMEALNVEEGPPPSETPHLIEAEVAQRDVQRLEEEAQALVRELEEEERRLAQLERQLRQLRTIADLRMDLEAARRTRYTFLLLGTMPVANLDRLETSLEFIPSVLVVLKREGNLATVVLSGRQRDADVLNRAARSAYLNPISLPEKARGTPAEAIAALEASIERTCQRLMENRAAIERLHEMRVGHLRHLLWRVRASRTVAEAIARYGRLRYTYLTAGWVPTAQLPLLERKIKQVSDKVLIEVETPRRQEDGHIPVTLKNPPIIRSFQSLVSTYGYPRYTEIDPTPLVALTFPFIFGIMFGDVGHGLLLALLGLLLVTRKIRAARGLADFGVVITLCGAAAALFGFLYGSFFGSEEVLSPLWLRPLEDIMTILMVTVGIGVILLNVGMVLSVINAAMARQWSRLLFSYNGLAGIVLYWSLLGLAAGAFIGNLALSTTVLVALAGVSGLVATFSDVLERLVEGRRPLIEGSLGTYLIQLPVELFETIIRMLSNTLSYVRMGAFAVAHGTLSMVVFIAAEGISPAHGPGYWVVVALGNLFILGFEGLIVTIQTLRLEYYEFFGKFFSGGGVQFRPLMLIPGKERQRL